MAEEAVRLAQGAVRVGTRTNTDVLDAMVELNRAKASLVKAQIDSIDSLGSVELAVGLLLLFEWFASSRRFKKSPSRCNQDQ